jgi:hypothetical protein
MFCLILIHVQLCSHTNQILSNLQWFLFGIIRVSSDEILEQKFWISKVTGIILEWLSVASDKSFLQIGRVPDPFFHIITSQHMFSFANEFICSHLYVFIEKVATKYLLSIFIVQGLGMKECISHNSLGNELEILVVEKHVVII